VLLAGVFAATMSTADSQILSCSAAVTQDIAPGLSNSYLATKLATLAVAGLALTIALVASKDVFGLVLAAWSALGATLGPLLLVRLAGRPLPAGRALLMMTAGVVTVFSWTGYGLSGAIFELLPGILVPLAIYVVAELVVPARVAVEQPERAEQPDAG
jgi:sodium/proline symporter